MVATKKKSTKKLKKAKPLTHTKPLALSQKASSAP
jgi:hypothetical protein